MPLVWKRAGWKNKIDSGNQGESVVGRPLGAEGPAKTAWWPKLQAHMDWPTLGHHLQCARPDSWNLSGLPAAQQTPDMPHLRAFRLTDQALRAGLAR